MRIALIILIGIHGLIHLFGFFKAFEISEFNAISHSISKISGLFWLLTFLLFVLTLVLMMIQSDYWWIPGILAVIVSQVLIFGYWSDAKFGTIANAMILLAAIVAYSNYSFRQSVMRERKALFSESESINDATFSKDEIKVLPAVIQKWLNKSGAIGKPMVSNVYLTQELRLKLKPEQTEWNKGTAEQYFTIRPPAFNWNISTEMNPFMGIVGRDKFTAGKGEMQIKLLSIIPVVDAKNEGKIDQATLQRYLAEIVWFPSAALSPYIQWEGIDSSAVKATMEFNGTKGSGVFHFDEQGNFKKFVARRYKDVKDSEPTEWVVTATKTEERNGINIPVECEASWNLADGQWTWLKLEIKHIEYNVEKMPVADHINNPEQ